MKTKRLLLIFGLAFLSWQLAMAQGSAVKITGSIKDDSGKPLIGASIGVSGSTAGAVTDVDGKFAIQASPENTLIISYLGHVTQRVRVGNRTVINITLREDSELLDEVVVTAMGITRDARSLSFARQAVDTKSMTETRDASLLNMLAGKVSGLQVINAGGPLSSTRIVIRGVNSMDPDKDNQPLFVVDGVIIQNTMGMGRGADLDYGNAANNINPDDIESMEVLKGANASALYGSQAANGVILITTKKGTNKGGLGVSYGYNMEFSHLYQYPTMQNVYGSGIDGRFYSGGVNYYNNSGGTASFNPEYPYGIYSYQLSKDPPNWSWGMPMLGFDVVGRNGEIKKYSPSPTTFSDLYQTGTKITNSISIDKVHGEGSSTRFSYTNIHSDDILENFNIMNRHSFSLRSVSELAKFVSLDASIRYVYEDVDNRGYRNSSDRNPLYIIVNLPRDVTKAELTPYKNPDGTPLTTAFINPYWILNESSNGDDSHWLLANATLNFTLTKFLKLRTTVATDVQSRINWRFDNFHSPFDKDGRYEKVHSTSVNSNFDFILMYDQALSDKIRLGANFGSSLRNQQWNELWSAAEVLLQPDMKTLTNSQGERKTREDHSAFETQSLYGAVNFSYDNWLFLEGTGRNDWNSTLPMVNNSYFYYSFGTGIILTDMLKIQSPVLSFAKLRASYAQVGSGTGFDRLINGYRSPDPYRTFLGNTFYEFDRTRKNALLKPEKTNSSEVGMDLRLFNGRFTLDATYYEKSTTNQIITANISKISGYNNKVFNAGEVQNKGVELSAGITPVETKDFSWTMNLNWGMNRSKVVSLVEDIDRMEIDGAEYDTKLYLEVGKPYGVIYGNDFRRNEAGQIYVDLNGRPFTEPDQYLGAVEPKFMGGVRNSFTYKNFDFSFLFDYKKGGKLWSRTATMGGNYGQTVQSLAGREENYFSTMILGESNEERNGFLSAQYTVNPNYNQAENSVLYPDADRPKGVIIENTVYGPDVEYWAGKPGMAWVRPIEQFTHNAASNTALYVFDASFIKLRSISFGYNVPKNVLAKTPIRSARISAVGRNVAILYQKTPKGIDPEATSSVLNNQGFERGFALPSATWGFDLKVSF